MCSELHGPEATHLCWCGLLPLLDVLVGNGLAAEVAVWLLGPTGFDVARSESEVNMGQFLPADSGLPSSLNL